jgi:hypothetical protein
MPSPLLHEGASVQCAHSGDAKPTVTNPRVKVDNKATVPQSGPYSISGCSMPSPSAGNGPCATAQWTSGTTRVTSNNQPLLFMTSQASCVPTGTPLVPQSSQTRVLAT